MDADSSVIPFSGAYTPENARLAQWAIRRTDKRGLVGLIVGVLLVVLPFVAVPPIRGLNGFLIFGSGLVNLWVFLIQPEWRTGKDWKRIKRELAVSGRLSDSGFEIRWKDSESRSSWSSFRNGRVAGSLILFEDVTGRPYYLPKSFFATDREWEGAGARVVAWAPRRND